MTATTTRFVIPDALDKNQFLYVGDLGVSFVPLVQATLFMNPGQAQRAAEKAGLTARDYGWAKKVDIEITLKEP